MTTSTSSAMPRAAGGGLSGWEATRAIGALSLRRVLRGKALWVALGLALLPCLLAVARRAHGSDAYESWRITFGFFLLVLPIVPPILVAASLSDELDDKTSAYLWSRALPRWSVVSGKLLGLAPVCAAAMLVGLTLSWFILGGDAEIGQRAAGDWNANAEAAPVFWRHAVGLTAGAIGASAISALFATLVPRFAVPIAVCWLLLLDAPIGALDMNLHVLAISYGAREIAKGAHVLTGVTSLSALVAIALAISMRRIARLE